jgi:hypothetical protein
MSKYRYEGWNDFQRMNSSLECNSRGCELRTPLVVSIRKSQ